MYTAYPYRKSNYYYLDILDAIADNKDTLMSLLYDLYEQFIQKKGCQYLVVTGDAKVYEKFQSLKIEYTGELHWLVPYPGDWHMLKNYQLALMKPYFDAGLKSLAEACGYPVHAIKQCSQFKKTLLNVGRLSYANKFLECSEMTETLMTRLMDDLLDLFSEEGDNEFRLRLGASVTGLMQSASFSFDKFWIFIEKMCHSDETRKFWVQFVFVDALAYVGLFLALRSGDWQLRMISIKLMAPLSVAFDHSTYQKLISNHIHDLLNLPDSMLLMLSQGAFVVNICGREWHSVGIDEAHEMLINNKSKCPL